MKIGDREWQVQSTYSTVLFGLIFGCLITCIIYVHDVRHLPRPVIAVGLFVSIILVSTDIEWDLVELAPWKWRPLKVAYIT